MMLAALLSSYKLMTSLLIADIANDVGQSFSNIRDNYPKRLANLSGKVSFYTNERNTTIKNIILDG